MLIGIAICAATLAILPLVATGSSLHRNPASSPPLAFAADGVSPGRRPRVLLATRRYSLGYALYATLAPPPEYDYLTGLGFQGEGVLRGPRDRLAAPRTRHRSQHPSRLSAAPSADVRLHRRPSQRLERRAPRHRARRLRGGVAAGDSMKQRCEDTRSRTRRRVHRHRARSRSRRRRGSDWPRARSSPTRPRRCC